MTVFPDLPYCSELFLSHNPFTKIRRELLKFKQYIRDNPDCIHDYYDIIDKGYHSIKLSSKQLKVTRKNGTHLQLPDVLNREIRTYLYNKAGKPSKKKRKSNIKLYKRNHHSLHL